jgi:hypothetical protein
MKCENCGCAVCEAEIVEVDEMFGWIYNGRCVYCASIAWHDDNPAPDEGDDE